jgi:hypothetical protein
MYADQFYANIYDPAATVAARLIGIPRSPIADQMLMTIAGQESLWTHRLQIGGPARSFWQFEMGGGVAGVNGHRSTGARVANLCAGLALSPADAPAIYNAMALNDTLAVGTARLLLYSDPKALPTSMADGWAYYLRTWRPGRPREETWEARWNAAAAALKSV